MNKTWSTVFGVVTGLILVTLLFPAAVMGGNYTTVNDPSSKVSDSAQSGQQVIDVSKTEPSPQAGNRQSADEAVDRNAANIGTETDNATPADNPIAGGYAVQLSQGVYQFRQIPAEQVGTDSTVFAAVSGGSISGHVYQSSGTTPVSGAMVVAQKTDGQHFGSGTSAADGAYTISGLTAGNYVVYAVASGLAQQYFAAVYERSLATLVPVSSNSTSSNIDFSLNACGTISGHVFQANGTTPISGALVESQTADGWFYSTATTGPDGSYTIPSLEPGSYHVVVIATNYALKAYNDTYFYNQQTSVTVTALHDTGNIDFNLDLGGSVSGFVHQADGVTPIAGASVVAMPTSGATGIVFSSNSDGSWGTQGNWGWLYPGSYWVYASAPGYIQQYFLNVTSGSDALLVNITASQNTPNINFSLTASGSTAIPTIAGISPVSGPASGGTYVIISGTNFISNNTTLTIGGAAATGVSVPNSSTVTAVTPPGAVGSRDVVITTPGGSATLTNGFDYIPTLGPPVMLAFIFSPADVAAASSFAAMVAVQDASGNTVSNSTAPVTLSITSGAGASGAVLSGTRTVNAVNGIATFSGLSIDKPGTGYRLTATSGSFNNAVSLVFDVSAGASVDFSVALQGGSRPDSGWAVPLTIKFFTPGTTAPTDVLTASPVYTFGLNAVKSGSSAVVTLSGIVPGTYDVSAVSPHCLTNVNRGVVITAPSTSIDMGTLLEGNSNDDNKINIQDFGILASAYGKVSGASGFDARADFDRNGAVNITDFGLLAANYGKSSPITVVSTLKNGGTLRYIYPYSPTSTPGWPDDRANVQRLWAMWTVFEPLVKLQQDGTPAAWLATSWNWDAPHTSVTFGLRQGVKFSDGTPFTAEAVKMEGDIVISTQENNAVNWDRWEIIDDYHVRLYLKSFQNDFWGTISQINMCFFSPAAYKANGQAWMMTHPIGTGPFLFKSFEKDVSLKFVKNPNYWMPGKPYLDGIDLITVKESLTQQATMQAGEGDILALQQGKILDDMKKLGFNILASYGGTDFIVFDTANAGSQFNNVKVRQAVEYAINKQDMVDALGYGYLVKNNQMPPPNNPAYDKNLPSRDYNVAKAKQLLSDAGFPNGFNASIVTIGSEPKVLAIQQYLKAVGINLTLNSVDNNKFWDYNMKGWTGLLDAGFAVGTNFPAWLKSYFPPTAIFDASTKLPDNVISAIAPALNEVDPVNAKAMSDAIIQNIYYDASMIPIYSQATGYILAPYVKDCGVFDYLDFSVWSPEKTWLDR